MECEHVVTGNQAAWFSAYLEFDPTSCRLVDSLQKLAVNDSTNLQLVFKILANQRRRCKVFRALPTTPRTQLGAHDSHNSHLFWMSPWFDRSQCFIDCTFRKRLMYQCRVRCAADVWQRNLRCCTCWSFFYTKTIYCHLEMLVLTWLWSCWYHISEDKIWIGHLMVKKNLYESFETKGNCWIWNSFF